jgi:hypothetical protein
MRKQHAERVNKVRLAAFRYCVLHDLGLKNC